MSKRKLSLIQRLNGVQCATSTIKFKEVAKNRHTEDRKKLAELIRNRKGFRLKNLSWILTHSVNARYNCKTKYVYI